MKVLVSVPNQGWIHKHVMHAVMRIMQTADTEVTFISPTWRPYEHSMNRIAKDFLAGDFDRWLNIDADNPPTRNPLDNLHRTEDVIGYPTPVWRDDLLGIPLYWNAMEAKADGYVAAKPGDGVHCVDAVGSGCVMFSRNAVESVRRAYGAPFVRETDDDGLVTYGPDFNFCRRAKNCGCTIAVDWDRPCQHFCEIELAIAASKYAELSHG